jgi:hypothetical protein
MRKPISDFSDWDLILATLHYTSPLRLTPDQSRVIEHLAWQETDAYGPKGHVPPQGYDWSGYRDSSEEATTRIAEVLRRTLTRFGITELEPSPLD